LLSLKFIAVLVFSLKEWDYLEFEEKNKDFLSERDQKEKYFKTPIRFDKK
jgi:hypothetical protein